MPAYLPQVDRAHRNWTPAQIGFIANIVRLYRAETPDFALGGEEAEAKFKCIFGKKHPMRMCLGYVRLPLLMKSKRKGGRSTPGAM